MPRAFGAQGCALLRVLQPWEVSQDLSQAGLARHHRMDGAQTSRTLHLLSGAADLNVTGSCAALQGQHTGLCDPAHAEGTVPVLGGWGDGQCTAQNAAGSSKTVMWETGSSTLSHYLLHASLALNKVSTERPVGFCRGDVNPTEVLMNISALCRLCHHP